MISNADNKEHFLKNELLNVIINEKGAELASLKSNGNEYIWQANPKFWARHAPILFPIVGRLIDNEFTYHGKSYNMKQHGFARDSDFELIDTTNNSIAFELLSSEKSKEIFPFDFRLQVVYTVVQKSLKIEYTVINASEKNDLYFSIGAHPAFNCPFEPGHHKNEYQLIFDASLAPGSENILDGLRTSETSKVFEQRGELMLHKKIFDNDALIFNPNPFSKITFVHEPSQKEYLSVAFKNYPYLGIWSSNGDAPFVCIEPWQGITDHKDHNKEFSQKEGVIKLLPNKTFNCEFTIEVL